MNGGIEAKVNKAEVAVTIKLLDIEQVRDALASYEQSLSKMAPKFTWQKMETCPMHRCVLLYFGVHDIELCIRGTVPGTWRRVVDTSMIEGKTPVAWMSEPAPPKEEE